jgi:hypothetical protein
VLLGRVGVGVVLGKGELVWGQAMVGLEGPRVCTRQECVCGVSCALPCLPFAVGQATILFFHARESKRPNQGAP